MRALAHPLLHRVLGLALGAIFLYASLDKIAHPADFARIVYHYQVIGPSQHIPPFVPNVFAVVLPWVEAVAGLLLIAGVWRREAALTVALLLVLFLGGVGAALARGLDVKTCGCFTVTDEGRHAGLLLLLEDSLMLVAAAVLTAVKTRSEAAAGAPEAAPAR